MRVFKRIKKTACGYRNKEQFKTVILFHLGGLNLMPLFHMIPKSAIIGGYGGGDTPVPIPNTVG